MLSAVEVHSLCSELEVLLTLLPKSRECRRGEFKVVARGANSRTLSVRTLSRRRPRSLLLRFSTSAPSCIAPGTDLGVQGGALLLQVSSIHISSGQDPSPDVLAHYHRQACSRCCILIPEGRPCPSCAGRESQVLRRWVRKPAVSRFNRNCPRKTPLLRFLPNWGLMNMTLLSRMWRQF